MGKKRPSKAESSSLRGPRPQWLLVVSMLLAAGILLGIFLPKMHPAAQPDTFSVLTKMPHDPLAYSQGLLFLNGIFYESTGLYGESSLRKVAPDSGQILEQRRLSNQFFGEGLAYFKGVLVQLTWKAGRAFVYDSDSLELLRMFFYEGEGWGLTQDGTSFIMSDGSNHLYFREPSNFEIQRTIDVMEDGKPITALNELEYIHGEVWANVYQTFDIVRISPENGEVLGRIDMSEILQPEDRNGREDALNGIAYDLEADRLFVTGKRYSHVYQIEIQPKTKGETVAKRK